LSPDIKTAEDWEANKKIIRHQEQQRIRNQRIEKKANERKELVIAVKNAEAEKKEIAMTGFTIQATALAMLNKVVMSLKAPQLPASQVSTKDFQELKEQVGALTENIGQLQNSLALILTAVQPKETNGQ
jgi:hypothetical protein